MLANINIVYVDDVPYLLIDGWSYKMKIAKGKPLRIVVVEKVKWEQIAVGEVFAWNGCWCIGIKVDTTHTRWLSNRYQRLWRQDT